MSNERNKISTLLRQESGVRKNVTIEKIILWVAILSGFWWHLQAAWHQQLFGDEVHSLFFFANNSWISLLQRPVEPIHPNGYYLLLKFLYTLTPSVLALRFWMVGSFVASCWVLSRILKQLRFPSNMSLAIVALWSSSAYIWHFSFQLRMYGPAMTLLLLSLLTLMQKKYWWSMVVDWLLLFLAYGSIVGIVAKWLAWFLFRDTKLQKARKFWVANDFAPAALSLLPVFVVVIQFWQQQAAIDTSYLYWVHQPVFADWSLAFLSFFAGLFLPYFEGYSALSQRWMQLGAIANWGFLLAVFGGFAFAYRQKKIIVQWWKQRTTNERLLLLISLITITLYTTIFGWSLFTQGHIFHVRQLFPVAVIGWLFMAWLLNQIHRFRPVITFVLVTGILAINQTSIIKDTWADNQAYPHHFQPQPGTPVIASQTDIELIYKQCQTFTWNDVEKACAQHHIFLLEKFENTQALPSTWWLTTRAYQTWPEKNQLIHCSAISLDFWECRQQEF